MAANDGVTFEALGKVRTLRFSVNAFCDLEDKTGIGMGEIIETLKASPKMTFLRDCFWAGLRGADPAITSEEAGDVIDALGFEDAANKLGVAVNAAFPAPKKGTPARPRR